MENIYLKRYAWPGPQINILPKKDTKIIVVIPCYNEPGILGAINALENCKPPLCNVEIIVVINHGVNEDSNIVNININSAAKIQNWILAPHKYQYQLIRAFDLPSKKAGVGLARKIGMDEAIRRFDVLNEKRGIIACFDADCTCSANYLTEIECIYNNDKELNAALVYFEHDIESLNNTPKNQRAILDYELHLRYYVQALKYANFPYAYHTVGSCITVSSSVYQKQGGMNLRKAGEDFYFLQRIFPLGHIANNTNAKIIPSSRASDRVPFGTGKAVSDILKNPSNEYFTYNPKIFADFKFFNDELPGLYHTDDLESFLSAIPESVHGYLIKIDFTSQVMKIKKNHKSQSAFIRSFYNWFNGFKALKYVHYARDNYYKNVEVYEAVNWIIKERLGYKAKDKYQSLELMRDLDRSDQ